MPHICHFEITADDIERAKQFYQELFNWKVEKYPGDFEYWGVQVPPTANPTPLIYGGLMKKSGAHQGIIIYVQVDVIDDYLARVERIGGKIISAKRAIPGGGYIAICQDPERNSFGLWQADKEAK